MTASRLMAELDNARAVRYDGNAGLILAWHGGHGVHAYDATGQEVAYWSVGDFAQDDADIQDVWDSMGERITSGEYD